jgi:glycosyltransferase involved in cell wall biosynthesis
VNVLFHLLDAGIGGGQLVAYRVAESLVARGDRVHLVVPGPGPAVERFVGLGAQVTFLDATTLRRPLSAFALARGLRGHDVLYSHTSIPGLVLGAVAARLARRPQLVHQHTYPYFSESPPARRLQRLLLHRLVGRASFIAVAEHVKAGLVAAGIDPARIVVIPNGVASQTPPRPPDRVPPSVGLLARLDPGKNIHVFLDAVERMRSTPRPRFVIGGASGPFADYEARVRTRANELGVEIVAFDDGDSFLRGMDVVVIPSSYEGSPLVLYEAMALGRAIIASEIPGISEAIGPTHAGVLVPPEEVDDLAAALDSLVDDPARRAALGKRALAVADERYRLDRMLERTLSVISRARP